MKNVEIAEGGRGRRLSGTKFILTDKPESDQMEVWVDEDDRKLARLYATSNGTYYPEEYDAYGFSSVTVSIHGGVANPDLPSIEMPDGTIVPALIPEIEMPDGTILPIDELFPEIAEDPLTDIGEVKVPDTVGEEGSSIVGIDPEDGYTYKVDVDENGNLDVEKVPTDIKIVQAPDSEYTFGQDFDPDDFKVQLVDKDGNVVKTKEYPDGTVPADDSSLTLPDKAPDREEVRQKGTFTAKSGLFIDAEVEVGGVTGTVTDRLEREDYGPPMAGIGGTIVMVEAVSNRISGYQCFDSRQSDGQQSFTANGQTVYYYSFYRGYTGFHIMNLSPVISPPRAIGPTELWVAMYGAIRSELDLSAEWRSPYSGYVLEDGTKVTVSDPGYGDL